GALGGVVRYTVQADLFATVDRTLAERAHEAGRRYAAGPPYAGRQTRTIGQSRLLDPMTAPAEGSLIGSTRPGALPPLQPRVLPRDPAGGPPGVRWDEPWDRQSYDRSLAGRTVYSTVRDRGTPVRVLSMPIERRGKVDEVLQLCYPLDG